MGSRNDGLKSLKPWATYIIPSFGCLLGTWTEAQKQSMQLISKVFKVVSLHTILSDSILLTKSRQHSVVKCYVFLVRPFGSLGNRIPFQVHERSNVFTSFPILLKSESVHSDSVLSMTDCLDDVHCLDSCLMLAFFQAWNQSFYIILLFPLVL